MTHVCRQASMDSTPLAQMGITRLALVLILVELWTSRAEMDFKSPLLLIWAYVLIRQHLRSAIFPMLG